MVEEFKSMILEREDLDPFLSWDKITEIFKNDSRFNLIASDKKRQAIFNSITAILVDRYHKNKRENIQTAKVLFDDWLSELIKRKIKRPETWTEASREIKKQEWYKLLDPKEMEREFHSKLRMIKSNEQVYRPLFQSRND